MQLINVLTIAFFALTARACEQCPHPGNFTGTLTHFADPADAYCSPGNQTAFFASIPIAFFDPPDESPCDGPMTVTNPSTGKTITATAIGKCSSCTGDDIQLTTAAMAALSPNGKATRAPKTVNWTFVG
ncbi:hypothetical protein BDR22DRAFT_848917 [Usnea florida]